MRLFQAIEAQYAALRAINGGSAGDGISRAVATLLVVVQVFPAMHLWLRKDAVAVQSLAVIALALVSAACLDARRARLSAIYWDQHWVPSMKQRLALGGWGLLVLFAVALSARVSAAGSLALFVALGALPLREWVNRLAT